MKNTLVLAAIITVGALSQAGADHSLLPPRAQALFPRMAGHEATATGGGSISHTYLGAAAKAQAQKPAVGMSRTSGPDLVSRPVYTGKWPFNSAGQQSFEIAPLKNTGKQCDANCEKDCCKKK